MSQEAPPAGLQTLEEIKHWKPDAQAKALELLHERDRNEWHPFYCPTPECNGFPHVLAKNLQRECSAPRGHRWVQTKTTKTWVCKACKVGGNPIDAWLFNHARADQRPPAWNSAAWRAWLMKGGRGSGKTETGSRLTHRVTEKTSRIILVAATGPDFRDTMVEGESGILATSPPGKRPTWEPSLKKLTWPNGCIAKGYSAEEPDRLRGPQSGFIWMDEPAHYPLIDKVYDNALLGMRMGRPSHVLLTSTPLPTKWMKKVLANQKTISTTVSTYENLDNLDPAFRELIIEEFEGTTRGRQELHGELLEDVEGSLWKMSMMRRIPRVPDGDTVLADGEDGGYVRDAVSLVRVVVSVDPAGTTNPKSDETGIVVVALGDDGNIYVLADYTDKYSPAGWAAKAVWAFEHFSADAIVAEQNYGGDMVRHTLETTKVSGSVVPPVIEVNSRRGKALRAEPMVGLYEKGKVFHVVGTIEGRTGLDLVDLEDEMTTWIPGHGPSPNRVDALVHGLTELGKNIMPASIATPDEVLDGMYAPTNIHGTGGFRRGHLTSIPGLMPGGTKAS